MGTLGVTTTRDGTRGMGTLGVATGETGHGAEDTGTWGIETRGLGE